MWAVVGRYALEVALWCLHNPDKIDRGITEVHALVDAIHEARSK